MNRTGVAFLRMLSKSLCSRGDVGDLLIFFLLICSWADGWRGFIDGAFEMGRSSAWRVLKEERNANRASKL